ncbi:unnamed protein product, partial [Rotaria magnacalcarata]
YTSVSTFVSLWLPFTVNYTWEQRKCELLRPTVYKVCGIISIIVTHIVPFVFLVILDILIVHRLKTNHYDTSMQHSVLPKNNRTATNSSTPASSLFRRELRKMFRCIKHRDRKLNNDQRTKPFNTMNKRDILPEHKNLL